MLLNPLSSLGLCAGLCFGLWSCAASPPTCIARRPSSAGSTPEALPESPYVLVLGSAQDGGLPQIACQGQACRAARAQPERARRVVSLLLVDPRSGRRWLFEATPDLPLQLESARARGALSLADVGRPPLFDGIFLTHAHMGHYAGLLQLGREAYGGASTPLFGSPRLLGYLRGNGPWSLLFEDGQLEARELTLGQPLALAADLSVTPIAVPHREEFSDTLAFLIRGPERTLLFLPDIDKWERWEQFAAAPRRIEDLLREVDVALLDGTFYADGEIPGRSMESIPHPFVAESLTRFAPLAPELRARVRFIHLNHTNPCADPASAAAARVRAAGMSIAADGELHPL